ncbi:MAG: Maf family protein [Myxococcota bacterium]
MLDLVLASGSPRRLALLRSAGLRVHARPVDCDETPLPHEAAVALARRLARAKLDAALDGGLAPSATDLHPAATAPVLTADTVVWRATTAAPLGKPRDRAHARQVLQQLSGGDHFVTTAWALARPRAPVLLAHETTRVWMRALDEDELDAYLDTDEWSDKAGGYGIQGHAAGLVLRLEGSYTNVVGLPLAQVLQALRRPAGHARPAAP